MTSPGRVDLVVVGAGLYGLTYAREAAERGLRVVVIDKRDHIGGNAYSRMASDEIPIEVHQYGAHLFHTSNEKVWSYANRFTSFTGYEHRVFTRHLGEVFPMPIGLATINQYLRTSFSPQDARHWVAEQASQEPVPEDGEVESLEQHAISLIGRPLYEAFIREYTQKQWQTDPTQLPASVIARLPVRYNYDTRYFADTHEGLPTQGYTHWLENLAGHRNISVVLSTDYFNPHPSNPWSKEAIGLEVPLVYTGPIDRYFDYAYGQLGWRTTDFKWDAFSEQDHQGTAVINAADLREPWTRTIEFKHFHPERPVFRDEVTVVATEFSRFAMHPDDEPYYPVNSVADRTMLLKYREAAKKESAHGVTFGGRLGTYQYLDMHMAIGAALADSSRAFHGRPKTVR